MGHGRFGAARKLLFGRRSAPSLLQSLRRLDPDAPYYRGHGWYRTRVSILNPLKHGRTLLYFEGAGQTSHVYVGNTLVGTHVGGYDEFVFDITDALFTPAQTRATSPAQPKTASPSPYSAITRRTWTVPRPT